MQDNQHSGGRNGSLVRRSLAFQVIVIFGVLLFLIVGNAIYSSYTWYHAEIERLNVEFDAKLDIAQAVLADEVSRVEHVRRTVQEQTLKYMELLDYDKLSAIRRLLQSSAVFHNIDLILLVDENNRVISNKAVLERPHPLYLRLVNNGALATDIIDVSAFIFEEQLPGEEYHHENLMAIRSGMELKYDSGGTAGYIILLKLLCFNQELKERLADLTDAEVIIATPRHEIALSTIADLQSYHGLDDNRLRAGGAEYFAREVVIRDRSGDVAGKLIVAMDDSFIATDILEQLAANLLPFIGTLVVALILLTILKRRVLDRVEKVVTLHQQVARGDLDARIDMRDMGDGKPDEVTNMIVHLNEMLDHIKKLYSELLEARHQAEEDKHAAEAANRSKSAFLANMSHEIRTPLTAIMGFAEALTMEEDPGKRRVEIEAITRNGEHLLNVINEILDLSKIEVNKLEIEHIPVSLVRLIDDVTHVLRAGTENKGLRLDIDYEFPVPKTFTSDPTRLRQILLNLGNNAVKFTEKGSVTIGVSYRQQQHSVVFTVKDSGIGMTEEQALRVFGSFEQADSTVTRKYGGTGLGLHISARLARLLGGDITVESKLGIGSVFEVVVDAGEVDAADLAHDLQGLQDHEVSGQVQVPEIGRGELTGHVLVAEDGRDNRHLIGLLLDSLGVAYEFAGNGREAIAMAQSGDYDMILMDVQMPVMSGDEATRILRSAGYQKPIVALSANVMQEDIRIYIDAGCNDFLGKPIDRARFNNVVGECLHANIPVRHGADGALGEKLQEIEQQFIQGLPGIVARINDAWERRCWEELRRELHTLKGSSGNFDGCQGVSKLAVTAEQQVKEGLYDESRRTIDLIERESDMLLRESA